LIRIEVDLMADVKVISRKQQMTETQKCRFCMSSIDLAAVKCPNCSEWLKKKPDSRNEKLVAAIVSVVIPGAGLMYRSRIGDGIIWLVLALAGYIAGAAIGDFAMLAGPSLHFLSVVRSCSK